MTLTDAGALIAICHPADPLHQQAHATADDLPAPLLTTVPALTEALHLLGPNSRYARALQVLYVEGRVRLFFLRDQLIARCFELMAKYADLPMDFADASLVSAAEHLRTNRIFTFDRDFSVYRVRRGFEHRPFEIVSRPRYKSSSS